MADKKISALPAATTPLAGTEVLPIVQSGVTDQVSVANLTIGRDVAVKKLNPTDNVVMAAGKGIDFSANANAPGMTSELLNWYEEGTWTPNQGAGLTVVGSFSSTGTYTRIGRQVTVRGTLTGSTSVACAAVGIMCSNLPFASATDTPGNYFNGTVTSGGQIDAASSSLYAVGSITATSTIYFSVTYFV